MLLLLLRVRLWLRTVVLFNRGDIASRPTIPTKRLGIEPGSVVVVVMVVVFEIRRDGVSDTVCRSVHASNDNGWIPSFRCASWSVPWSVPWSVSRSVSRSIWLWRRKRCKHRQRRKWRRGFKHRQRARRRRRTTRRKGEIRRFRHDTPDLKVMVIRFGLALFATPEEEN